MTTATCAAPAAPALPAAPAAVACRLSLRTPTDHVRSLYSPIASPADAPGIVQRADQVKRILRLREKRHPAWDIERTKVLRQRDLDPDDYPFIYAGSASDCHAVIARLGDPTGAEVITVSAKVGTTSFVVSRQAIPVLALADAASLCEGPGAPTGCVVPATTDAHGQIALDLAAALDRPCLLMHADPDHPAIALLHHLPSVYGAWRLTYFDEYGPMSHEYPDRFYRWLATVPGMVGNAIHHGYDQFVGDDVASIVQKAPRLRKFFATAG